MSISTRTKLLRRLEFIFILGAYTSIIFQYYPIISADRLVGWDLTPHYYLLMKARDLVALGLFSGYDTQWFAGYPLFKLYGIGPYLAGLIGHWFTAGWFSIEESFHLYLSILPLLLLYGVYKLTRIHFGRVAGLISIPLFLFYYFSSPEYFAYGFSAHSEIRMGLFGAQTGLLLLVFSLWWLEIAIRQRGARYYILFATACALIGYTHVLTFTFASGIFLFLLFFKRYRKFLLKVAPLVALLTAPLFFEWLLFAPFHSSRSIGNYSSLDPLFTLLPGLKSKVSGGMFNESLQQQTSRLGAIILALLIGVGLYVRSLVRDRSRSYTILLVLGFVFIPREILTNILTLPIHYYRFVPVLIVLAILVASKSVHYFFKTNNSLKVWSGFCLYTGITAISFIQLVHFDWTMPYPVPNRSPLEQKLNQYQLLRSRTEVHESLDALIAYIQTLPERGRILVESNLEMMGRAGSPHAILGEIPRLTNREVLPGLLVESSMIGPVVLFSLLKGSDQMAWGAYARAGRVPLSTMSVTQIVDRFRKFGARYIIATSERYKMTLRALAEQGVVEKKQFGIISLFEIGEPTSLVRSTPALPWYFYSGHNSTLAHIREFRKIGFDWWSQDALAEISLITSSEPKPLRILNHCESISGFIVHERFKTALDAELSSVDDRCRRAIITYVDDIPSDSIVTQSLRRKVQTTGSVKPNMQGLTVSAPGDALILYGFSPNLHPSSGELFIAAPGWIYSIGEGERIITFE